MELQPFDMEREHWVAVEDIARMASASVAQVERWMTTGLLRRVPAKTAMRRTMVRLQGLNGTDGRLGTSMESLQRFVDRVCPAHQSQSIEVKLAHQALVRLVQQEHMRQAKEMTWPTS